MISVYAFDSSHSCALTFFLRKMMNSTPTLDRICLFVVVFSKTFFFFLDFSRFTRRNLYSNIVGQWSQGAVPAFLNLRNKLKYLFFVMNFCFSVCNVQNGVSIECTFVFFFFGTKFYTHHSPFDTPTIENTHKNNAHILIPVDVLPIPSCNA